MKNLITKILVGGVWIALIFEIVIAYAVWTKTEIANYDVNFIHAQMQTNYCPYCGKSLKEVEE